MTPEELTAQLEESGIQPVNNAATSARLATPPPPEHIGLSPAGAYDVTMGLHMNYPVMEALAQALPEPGPLVRPTNSFNNVSGGPSDLTAELNTGLDLKPEGFLS